MKTFAITTMLALASGIKLQEHQIILGEKATDLLWAKLETYGGLFELEAVKSVLQLFNDDLVSDSDAKSF